MRIQHNLSAMNSMSNYKANNSALSNNLEKLSSGYKINSAADDAAGLAISEKMRSQIAGLEKAQDNANDGISLVQTAEGALTEVNSMLTRLTTLATQSANGTYEDGVDRANIQEETDALLSEIDRISESTNFNGIKLLDGSLSGKSQISNLALTESTATKGKFEAGDSIGKFISASSGVGAVTGTTILANKTALAAAAAATVGDATASMKAAGITTATGVQAAKKSAITGMDLSKLSEDDIGSSIDYTVKWTDADGNEQTTTAKLTFQGQGDGTVAQMLTGSTNTLDKLGEKTSDSTKTKNYFTDDQGNKYYLQEVRTTSAATASAVTASKTFVNNYTITSDDVQKAIKAGLENDETFSSNFKTELDASGKLKFETKDTGAATATIEGTDVSVGFKGAITRTTGSTNSDLAKQIGGDGNAETTQVAADAMQKFDVTKLDVITSKSDAADIANKTFEIDGNKFVIADNTVSDDQLKKMDADLNVITIDEAGSVTSNSSDHIAAEIQKATGRAVEKGVADAGLTASRNITSNDIVFKDVDNKLKTKGNELTLQIGDTADSYQQVNVKIQDMSSSGLGLKGLDLSTQESASKAIDTIKTAVNAVSSQRGQLGALQNRLDHTLNSLDATNQNITAAESQIRDTDMAKEMTQYSKNNILAQAAQSMLAQANSMPQGVLSLLG